MLIDVRTVIGNVRAVVALIVAALVLIVVVVVVIAFLGRQSLVFDLGRTVLQLKLPSLSTSCGLIPSPPHTWHCRCLLTLETPQADNWHNAKNQECAKHHTKIGYV